MKNKKAFTLVELIVVIVIIVIIWAIAFISISNYPKDARDSERMSNLKNMETSLELFKLTTWIYPIPEEIKTISSISWAIEWTFWENNFVQVWNLNKLPKDPLTEKTYTYFVSNDKKTFRIEALLENGSFLLYEIWT